MAKDILLDAADDLLIQNGDLVIGDSGEQEISLLLRSNPGDWRASPLTGFGLLRRMRNEVNRTEFERALGAELELDGFTGVVVELSPATGLTISAKRNE
jgi:hypothetical protein